MPGGASAAGEAFELLSSRYLCDLSGLKHVTAPFYTHLARGKWVQFDGLFSRVGGSQLALEAKFYDAEIGLGTPGIAARITFAKEAGLAGVIFASRRGFSRDIFRARLPVEKVLLSWQGMAKKLSNWSETFLTAALDPVVPVKGGFQAATGAVLLTGEGTAVDLSGDGFAFIAAEVERWVRRLPASPTDVYLREMAGRRRRCRRPRAGVLDIEDAWAIEDSLRGFAPSDPKLLELAILCLKSEPKDTFSAWRVLWRLGYRGQRGGLKNVLENLVIMGVAEKFRTAGGLFYGLREAGACRDPRESLLAALAEWPAYAYFASVANGASETPDVLAARLSAAFARFYPYARSLYNPAKVSGLLALARYASSAASTARPSYAR